MKITNAFALLTLPGVASATSAVSASTSAPHDRWRVTVTPYVWATDVGIDAELSGRQIVDETIPVQDIVEDIDATFQGRIEAKKGAHGVMLDLFYVSMSDEESGVALPNGAGQCDVDWKMDMTMADIAATYDPKGDDQGVSFLYGARIIDQQTKVDATFTTSGGTSQQHYDGGDTLIDALAGIRFSADLSPHLRFQSQVDASTGGTDLTWSAFPSLSYSFGEGHTALVAGYRHMAIDFKEQGGVETEMSLSGPVLGFRWSF